MNLAVDAVFVITCKKGFEDRRRSIERQFGQRNIPFEYILDHDVADLSQEYIAERFNADTLRKVDMSIISKHFEICKIVVERKLKNVLVFEDDIVFLEAFDEHIEDILAEAKTIKGDFCVYFSNACHLYVAPQLIKKGKHIYPGNKCRAADSFYMNYGAALKRWEYFKNNKIFEPIDITFNHVDPSIGVDFLWTEKILIEQGSMNGLFDSSLETRKKKSLYRKMRWNLDCFYKKNIRSRFKRS